MKTFFDFEFIENGTAFVMEPISIGMVREDGAEYYAEFTNVSWGLANEFVLNHVKPYLTGQTKHNDKIQADILEFVGSAPEFWAYFADYDWVLLCQLFGRMVDLPKGWPFYCLDIKQLMYHTNIHKEDLNIINPIPHHALGDARWNKMVHDAIQAQCGGRSLRELRPREEDGSSNLVSRS